MDKKRTGAQPINHRVREGHTLKIAQGGGHWGFCVRIADKEGEPVDLTR